MTEEKNSSKIEKHVRRTTTRKMLSQTCGNRVFSIQVDEIPGYEILDKLGWGGMGTVWKAEQKSLQRIVALKVLHDYLVMDSIFIKRFFQEARSVAALNHPNIVQIYDVGVGKCQDIVFYAMEYIEGHDIDQLLGQGAIPLVRTLDIIYQAALALNEMHLKNIIHRDIKPGNILVTNRGQIKLTDMGLAKDTTENVNLTKKGLILGSPRFMAPEQISDPEKIDSRADIYSLGVTLYTMVTGSSPYQAKSTMEIFSQIFKGDYPPPEEVKRSIPVPVADLIKKMMHLEVERRPRNMGQVIEMLDSIFETAVAKDSQKIVHQTQKIERRRKLTEQITKIQRTENRLAGPCLSHKLYLQFPHAKTLALCNACLPLPASVSVEIPAQYTRQNRCEFEVHASDPLSTEKVVSIGKYTAFLSSAHKGIKLRLDIDASGDYQSNLVEIPNARKIPFLFQKLRKIEVEE